MPGPTADQIWLWTFAQTEVVLILEVTFIVIAKDVACSMYYTWNLRLDHVSGVLLFRLSANILDTLVYFGIYMLVLRSRTDSVLTVLVFKWCMEVD